MLLMFATGATATHPTLPSPGFFRGLPDTVHPATAPNIADMGLRPRPSTFQAETCGEWLGRRTRRCLVERETARISPPTDVR